MRNRRHQLVLPLLLVCLMSIAPAAVAGDALVRYLAADFSDEWMVSDWAAGQSDIVRWSPENVRVAKDGAGLEIVLDAAEPGAERPFRGGELQSRSSASFGTWAWVAQAPRMVDGAVFGLFLYRETHDTDPWREFDFEFVGRDTTRLQLNVMFERTRGEKRVTLAEAKGGPVIVDLGFDAAERPHLYEIELSPGRAIFRVDGKVVGSFTAEDMPGGVWNDGPLRSFVDLWAVAPVAEAWAGRWNYPGEPLVAKFVGAAVPDPD